MFMIMSRSDCLAFNASRRMLCSQCLAVTTTEDPIRPTLEEQRRINGLPNDSSDLVWCRHFLEALHGARKDEAGRRLES